MQERLLEIAEAVMPVAREAGEAVVAVPKLKAIERRQIVCAPLDVDTLVSGDHKVRAIWELTGRLKLDSFLAAVKSKKGHAGREHFDPRLLIAIWMYAYSEGISSAREVSRQMEYEPALRWLGNLEVVNHTTLSDFRKDHSAALEMIFSDHLAMLDQAGLIDLETVMHDGTKIQAQCSSHSFRHEKTLRERLEQARQVVGELSDPEDDSLPTRREARRRRAAEQRLRVLEEAAAELQRIQQSAPDKKEVRVSVSEPEARFMRHGGTGGLAPSYNVQLTTDAKQKVIVAADLNQCSSDAGVVLGEVVAQVETQFQRRPAEMVVDAGFTSHRNIRELAAAGVRLLGPVADTAERQEAARKASGIAEEFRAECFQRSTEEDCLLCPAGETLPLLRHNHKRGNTYHVYQAPGAICSQCEFRSQCCPKHSDKGRSVSILIREDELVAAHRKIMASAAAQTAYKRRSAVAETPNAWIKEKFGLRKFRLRGLRKVRTEMLWACLTYNVMQWVRLVWRPQPSLLCSAA